MPENLQNFSFNAINIITNLKKNWISIIIVIAGCLILFFIIMLASKKLRKIIDKKINDEKMETKKKSFTFVSVTSNLMIVSIFIIAILIVFEQLGINIVPILTGAGILGIILGFGAQSLIKDIINGSFILFEQWFQVSDVITVGEISGTVEKFNLRTTVIRDLNGRIHFIPNSQINILTNQTYDWAQCVVDARVHYKENTDKVIAVIEEVFDALMKDKNYNNFIIEKPSILGNGGISDLEDSSVLFKIICKVKPPNQWTIERQIRKLVKEKFDEFGIEIPYPSRNIYIRNSPPEK